MSIRRAVAPLLLRLVLSPFASATADRTCEQGRRKQ